MSQLAMPAPTGAQTLRPYQALALDLLRDRLAVGKRRVLLVSPTGSGKTTIAAAMISSAVAKGGSVLFLAHRRELIDQCSERLYQTGVPHGIIMAQHPRADAAQPVQIASVQTLARRLDSLPRATLVIVDEAHHARASTYAKILDAYPSAPAIGLSATPWRLDGRGLGELFEAVVVAARPRELTQQGHLVPFTGYAYDSPDLRAVRKTGADYNAHGLELAVAGNAKLAGNIIEQWQLHARGRRTVVFGVSIAHSQQLVERFREAGAAAEHVDGEMHPTLRAAALRRFTTGETTVLCNVNVLTEGWDCPAAEVCVLARPTLSLSLALQMVGRVLRPAPGKTVARIHDHAGIILRHGMPDADRDYVLDSGDKPKGPPPVRTCKACFATYEGGPRCPYCGHVERAAEAAESRETPKEGAGEAIPLEQLAAQMRLRLGDELRFLVELQTTAKERGYKQGWVGVQFKNRYGRWPKGVRARGRA